MAIVICLSIAIFLFVAFVTYVHPTKQEEDGCRYGFISFSSPTAGPERPGIVRVKEPERNREYSYLRVLSVSGCSRYFVQTVKDNYAGWIKDVGIKWDTERQEV